MEPEFGRDFTVAVVLIAAIVALATSSIVLGSLVVAAGVAAFAVGAFIRLRSASNSRPVATRVASAPGTRPTRGR
jgi:hypothetical protein